MISTFKKKVLGNKLTPTRVAIMGMLLALLVVFKFIFAFVPGVEVITFAFIFLALFLPLLDLVLLVTAFNFLVLALYGFGSWWIAYWPIFMIDIFASFSLRKLSRNRSFFAFICFLGGVSLGGWYFLSDLALFGKHFAYLNLITAIPINLIEAFVSMIMAIIFGPSLAKVFKVYSKKFWHDDDIFEFKPLKYRIFSFAISISLALASIAGIVLLFVFNNKFTEWRGNHDIKNQMLDPNSNRDKRLITTHDYNDIYSKLNYDDSAIVIVSGNKHWTYYAKKSKGKALKDYISNSKFYISFIKSSNNLGLFLRQAFLTKDNKQISPNDSNGAIGTNADFDSSPFIFLNGKTSSIGSNLIIKSKDIIEISYNGYWTKFTGKGSVSHSGKYYKNIFNNNENNDSNDIWIPIVASIGGIALILILIWSPNIYFKIKNKSNNFLKK
ncbi:hypothetical protein MYMA111404_02700 [Mycoplasma marinum]|uniref:Uncharacterized protein n=1 Tax=Mycoplasma marinum TaxID=1937190 RepID=A0A4R0XJL9_9MOLU|nr:hypothetical protein [Mycoplasma marinum]TCG10836.1 hypothetical protein C4B24_03850 [Mycoplasma marinum]